MSKNKKSKNIDNQDNMGFMDKMKTDKRYSAKVQFAAYGVFVLLVIIYLNISIMNGGVNNSVGSIDNNVLDEEVVDETSEESDQTLLEKLSNNYEYDITVNLTKSGQEVVSNRYYGKSYGDNVIINKVSKNIENTYYNIDNYYYEKNENDEYILIKSDQVYDLVESKYIEVDDVLKLIKKASLDHVVDSSTGAKENVYHLLVRDVVISNKSEDVVTIKVVYDEDKLSINIDYTNLMKSFDASIEKCEISYVYTNIDGVEEFMIMEDENEAYEGEIDG